MVTYQFQVDDDTWTTWKNTVPRTKSLEERLIELIEADTEGRVQAVAGEDIAGADSSAGRQEWERTEDTDPSPAPPTRVGEAPEEHLAGEERVETALEPVEFPASKDRQACVAAVSAAYSLLRERGEATKQEFVLEVMPDHGLGYDVDGAREKIEDGERFRGAWWRRVVKPSLEAMPDVEKPPRGGSEWTYSGEE